jgi:hypothetical protein
MTVINQSELAELSRLDQILMWCIISINASNLDARNTHISDNAAIRAESKDYISWQVVQDDTGAGKFTFSALLPIVNPHPLEDKVSLLSRIWSYSPYDPDMITEAGIVGYGWGVPPMPAWIETTEQLLAYVAVLASKIVKLAPKINGSQSFINSIMSKYWGNCQYQITDSAYGSQMTITGYLTLNWRTFINGGSLIRCLNPPVDDASHVNCNFPDLLEVWDIPELDLNLPVAEILKDVPNNTGVPIPPAGATVLSDPNAPPGSAEELINSYGQSYFLDDALPDWYRDAINNPPHLQTGVSGLGNMSSTDGQAPKLIESLPICKEQDPAVVSYGKSPLATVLGK